MASSNFDITRVSQAADMASRQARQAPADASASPRDVTVADSVRLSSDARRRMDDVTESQTIAEAFLKHLIETQATEAQRADKEKDPTDDAANKFKGAFDRMMVDLGWLIDALGVKPEEGAKLKSVLAARASVDYVTARPPVVEIIARSGNEGMVPTLFVQELTFEVHGGSIGGASVQRVQVTNANPSLGDPSAPRVVFVGGDKDAGAQGSKAAFEENLSARLATTPTQELHGMLIIRDHTTAGDTRRLRVDALMPLQKAAT